MRLYLMRHGKADFGGVDRLRPLSERGALDVDAVAKYLSAEGVGVARVYHSTLLRAKQTAEIMAAALKPEHAIEERVGIEPWGDVAAFVDWAAGLSEDTLVCGHEPFMGDAAMALRASGGDFISVKTATVMAFERTDDGWTLDWLINPKLIKKEAS